MNIDVMFRHILPWERAQLTLPLLRSSIGRQGRPIAESNDDLQEIFVTLARCIVITIIRRNLTASKFATFVVQIVNFYNNFYNFDINLWVNLTK